MIRRPASTTLLLAMLWACGTGAARATPETLDARCRAAIAHEDVVVPREGLKQTLSVATGPHAHLFQYTAADGGIFSCQLCDDANPAAACPSLGIDLAYRPANGELRRLPAELDRKCLDALQRELGTPEQRLTIKYDVVERVVTRPSHTGARWVFAMQLDDTEYRCVIRKSDGSYRVERHDAGEWRPIAAGTYY